MKKIGIDARFYSPTATGIGRHVSEVLDYLTKNISDAEFVVFLRAGAYDNSPQTANVRAIKADFPHYSLTEQVKFCQMLNREKCDLMIFPQFNFPVMYRGDFIVTIHDLTLHFFPGKKKTDVLSRLAYKYIIRKAAQKSKKVLAVSQNTKKDIIERLGIKASKISVVGNGVSANFQPITDTNLLAKFRAKHNLPDKYFLYTGVMRSHKNILGLVEAFAKFQEKNKEVELVLAGPIDKIYAPEIKKRAQELGIENLVHFTGFFPEEDFNLLFAAATTFVFPSFYEGFGIPPLEAMAAGIPVISSNTSSLPEACGDAVIYFDPYDLDEIAEAMAKSLDPETAQNLIKKGIEQYPKFTWEKVGEKYLKAITANL